MNYRQARNQCVKKLKNCKNEYFKKLFKKVENEKTTKKLYNLAGKLMGRNSISIPQQYLNEGTLIRKPAEMANFQMDFYVKKISDLMSKIKDEGRNPLRLLDAAIDRWEDKDKVELFEFKRISLAETSRLIATMAESTSHGHDKIDSIGIKAAADKLSRPLQHLINTSLVKGSFCQKWKFSKLTPLLKSQTLDRLSTSSYRPVAALSTISKIVERAGQQQLLSFFREFWTAQ